MHIAHLNIRSIVNKWDVFKAQFMSSNLHVLGLSETWLHEKLPTNLFKLSNEYVLLRWDRTWSENNSLQAKKGGGLGTYIRKSLNYSENDNNNLNISSKDVEAQWISIQNTHLKTIIIGNLYRPPQGNITSFIEYLENSFDMFDLDKVELFLMGDFNIDDADKSNVDSKKLH